MSPYRRVIDNIKRIFQRPPTLPQAQTALDVSEHSPHQAQIIPRDQHPISRNNISKNAVRVLYRLKDAGYQGFLVGGGVRDLLLDKKPKDFDIATDAHPDDVKNLFRNCRLIGRRFRLAHVHFGEEIIEVATFRAHHNKTDDDDDPQKIGEGVIENGRIIRDNVYGSLEEDAWRRDFTINALYYNIADFSVVDYTGGMPDIKARLLRLIGDPMQRYQEDPVRMLRAVRFAAKLDFTLEEHTEAPIHSMAVLLKDIPPSRLYEETLKLFLSGHGEQSFAKLRHYGLFQHLFGETHAHLQDEKVEQRIIRVLRNTDERVAEGKSVTPGFLFAAMLWTPVKLEAQMLQEEEELTPQEALFEASHRVGKRQAKQVAIPRRMALSMREIWHLQLRLERHQRGKRGQQLLHHPRFRAAYDFLQLRAQTNPEHQPLAAWWEKLQTVNQQELQEMTAVKKKRRKSRKTASTEQEVEPAQSVEDQED